MFPREINSKWYQHLIKTFAANVPSGAAHQRRPLHRQPGDSDNVLSSHRLVPLQPPRLPHRRQPPPPRRRGGPGPRLPPRGPLRQDRAPPRHPLRRRRGLPGRGGPGGHPQHLPHDVRHRLLQRRRAVHGAIADADRAEEGGGQAADGGGVGPVRRRVLLRGCFWCHLGILPPLRPQPPLLR